jgi:hypothetical protein
MPVKYSDSEIAQFVADGKQLPPDYGSKIVPRAKRGHKERELDVIGDSGAHYRLIVRESLLNPLDFSVILALLPNDSSQAFRLRRYNGKSHEHTNIIESQTMYDFHVHFATERYQRLGTREDAFAEATTRYADLHGALDCLIHDCGFRLPTEAQLKIF